MAINEDDIMIEKTVDGFSATQNSSELTQDQINDIASSLEEMRLRQVEDAADKVEIDENAKLESDTIITPIDGVEGRVVDSMPEMNISLFDIEDDEKVKQANTNRMVENAKDSLNLTDDDAIAMISIISEMKKNPKYPVYSNLPNSLKKIVDDIAVDGFHTPINAIPRANLDRIARMVMTEFASSEELNDAFIDLQKSIDEALHIPSIMDLYTEHTRKVMEENIPEMAESIKEEYPEKAKMLLDVKEEFSHSYTFDRAREMYESNSRLRKAVRRHDMEYKRVLQDFNSKNERSTFKMNDVTELPIVLHKTLIEDPEIMMAANKEDDKPVDDYVSGVVDMNITDDDIQKFCVLICKSCENLDPTAILDAAYMYYMMKNIIVLKYADEAKTDFAAELINNICNTIAFIRDKEAEFNAANLDKPKSGKKLRSDKGNRK